MRDRCLHKLMLLQDTILIGICYMEKLLQVTVDHIWLEVTQPTSRTRQLSVRSVSNCPNLGKDATLPLPIIWTLSIKQPMVSLD